MKTPEKAQQFHMSGSVVLAMEMARRVMRLKFGQDVRWSTLDIKANTGSLAVDWGKYYEDRSVHFWITYEHPTGVGFREIKLTCMVSHLQKANQWLEWWEPQWVEVRESGLTWSVMFAGWDQTGGKLLTNVEYQQL